MPPKTTPDQTPQSETPQGNETAQASAEKVGNKDVPAQTTSVGTKSAQASTSTTTAGSNVASGIGDKLAGLKKSFQDNQTQAEQLAKKAETFKQQITELERATSEIKQVVTSYTSLSTKLTQDKKELGDFLSTKEKMVDAAVGAQKAVVEKLMQDYEARRQELQKKAEDTAKQYEIANEEYLAEVKTAEDTKKAWEAVKSGQQSVDAKLKELKSLKTQFEQEDAKNNTGAMYFLIKEMRSIIDQINIVSPSDLEKNLSQAAEDLNNASDIAKQKQAQRDALKSEMDKDMAALKADTDKRREEQLKAIAEHTKSNQTSEVKKKAG